MQPMTMMLLIHILPLLLIITHGYQLPTTVHDMVEMQIPGTYTRIPLNGRVDDCSPTLIVLQVEVHGDSTLQTFVVPHSFQRVAGYPNGTITCDDLPVLPNPLTKSTSATILRRSRDVPADRRISILDRLFIAQEQYFVGYEHGGRVCNGFRFPDATTSIWTAPSQKITAKFNNLLISLEPGDKYILYFSNPPCFYKGDAANVGKVVILPSPTPPGGGIQESASGNQSNDSSNAVGSSRRPDCFPATASTSILTSDGISKTIRIKHLNIGDLVVDGVGGWTQVIAHTHSDAYVKSAMIQIRASNRTLTASIGHVIVTATRGYLRAMDIRVGDVLYSNGKRHQLLVTDVRVVNEVGRYAPVTLSGTMGVDDVLVTTYAIETRTAHALLAPVRAVPNSMIGIFASLVQIGCELGRKAW